MRRRAALSRAVYATIADGVRKVEDPAMRQSVADHFARYLHGRAKSFDPQIWFEMTGGLVNRRPAGT